MAQAMHSMGGVLIGAHSLQSCVGSGIARLGAVAGASGLPVLSSSLRNLQRSRQLPHKPGPARVRCSLNDSPSSADPNVYQGIYGPWTVDPQDVREHGSGSIRLQVILYRAGLVTCAAAFVTAASSAFLPEDFPLKSFIQGAYDPLYAVGTAGLGLSLALIHIYVTPIKRSLQLLWAVGVLGSLALAVNFAAPADQGLVEFVVENPAGVWAIGPLFAALTGLAFKEGLCYGKFEAGGLFFVIPSVLLGHLTGVTDDKVKLGLLAAWTILFGVFASRKFTQPIKDDIGDKSVFIFQALPEEERRNIAMKLQDQYGREGGDN